MPAHVVLATLRKVYAVSSAGAFTKPAGDCYLFTGFEVAVGGSVGKRIDQGIPVTVGVVVITGQTTVRISGEIRGGSDSTKQGGIVITFARAEVIGEVKERRSRDIGIVKTPIGHESVPGNAGAGADRRREGGFVAHCISCAHAEIIHGIAVQSAECMGRLGDPSAVYSSGNILKVILDGGAERIDRGRCGHTNLVGPIGRRPYCKGHRVWPRWLGVDGERCVRRRPDFLIGVHPAKGIVVDGVGIEAAHRGADCLTRHVVKATHHLTGCIAIG